jgi:hypothetical protein
MFHLITTATEEYDGSTWTSVNLNTARRLFSRIAGTQTAGLAFGGNGIPPIQQQQKNIMEQVGQLQTRWTI